MKSQLTLIAAAGATLFISACSKSEEDATADHPAPKEEIDLLAQVGDQTLTVAEFSRALERRRIGNSPEARVALLDEMVLRLKLVARAKELGLEEDPEIVRQYQDLLVARLKGQSAAAPELSATPTELELQQYYNAHQDDFKIPTRIRVAQIFVASPPNLRPEKRAQKRQRIEAARAAALSEAADNSHFGAIAMRYSEDQGSKARGGDIGYFLADSEHGNPIAAAFNLESIGQLSEIIETPDGFHLFKLMEKTPESHRPFASAAPRIRSILMAQRREAKADSFTTSATEGIPATINRAALEKFANQQKSQIASLGPAQTTPPTMPGAAK